MRKKTKKIKGKKKKLADVPKEPREDLIGGLVSVGPLSASIQTGHLAEVFAPYGEVRHIKFISPHK